MDHTAIVDDLAEVERRLARWFAHKLGDPDARLAALRRLPGGYSNPTFVVEVESGAEHIAQRRFALRWDPITGPQAPYDMEGQYETFRALWATDIPVPRPYWFESDLSVLGRAFWVCAFVEGESTQRLLDPSDPWAESRLAAFIAMLAKIHATDWKAAALDRRLPVTNPSDLGNLVDAERRMFRHLPGSDLALFEQAAAWLKAQAPSDFPLRLNHGDCNFSNVLFDRDVILAVLDWELASITDPMSDIGFYCGLIFRYRSDRSEGEKAAERQAFLAAYSAHTGASLESLPFWEAFQNYKFGLSWAEHGIDHPNGGYPAFKARLRELIGA